MNLQKQKKRRKQIFAISLLLIVVGITALILINPSRKLYDMFAYGNKPNTEAADSVPEVTPGLVAGKPDDTPVSMPPLKVLPDLTVRYIDVGQGDCTVISAGGEHMMIDTGYWYKQEECESALYANGISELKYLVLTHPDADHIGNADAVTRDFMVDEVLMPDKESDTTVYKIDMDAFALYNVPVRHISAGDRLTLGDAVIDVLGPVHIPEDPEDTNNASIVMRLVYGGTSFLFLGDAEQEEIADVMAFCEKTEKSLASDVMMLPHHGSGGSFNRMLYSVVGAKYYIISCGSDNEYGHPAPSVIRELQARDGKILLTQSRDGLNGSGTITVTTDGAKVTVTTEAENG